MGRYEVGCAGQFFARDEDRGSVHSYDDELEAFVAACDGPPGAYVVDTETGRSFGPQSQEEEDQARAELARQQETGIPDLMARLERSLRNTSLSARRYWQRRG